MGLVGGVFVADIWAPERASIVVERSTPQLDGPAPTGAATGVPAPVDKQRSGQALPAGNDPSGSAAIKRAAPKANVNPEFVWISAPNVARYEVIFERDGTIVYRATTSLTRLELPPSWRYNGKTHTLRPGRYHWTVWPLVEGRRGRPVVSSDYTV